MGIRSLISSLTISVFLLTNVLCIFPQPSFADVTGDDFGKKLVFEYNEELFTVYAYLNYTGYTEDNYTVHDPIRQGVIDDLNAMNLSLSNPAPGYTTSGLDKYYYDMYMRCISGAPDFTENPAWISSEYGVQQLRSKGIHSALLEFYNEADIHNLYKKYEAGYMKEINRLKGLTNDDCAMLFNTFHMDINQMDGQIYVDANFLMPRGRGETWLDPDPSRNNGYVIAYGPNYENLVGSGMVIHELLHHYVNPIMDKYPDKVQAFIRANNVVEGGPYNKETMVTESFIRGMQDIPDGYCQNDDSIPFPMMFKIFDYYKTNYNPATGNLESFIVDALDYYSQSGVTSTLSTDPSTVDLEVGGGGKQINVYATRSNGARADVTDECTFSMANSTIASVRNGYFSPLAIGDTTVTISYEHAAPIVVNVHVGKSTSVVVNADCNSIELSVGGAGRQITVTATDGDGNTSNVTGECSYSIENENVAVVSRGLVTPVGAGSTRLTVNYGDSAPIYINIKVNDITAAPSKITVSPKSMKLKVGDSAGIQVYGYYSGSPDPVLINSQAQFVSSKGKVCVVDESGQVTAIKKGTARITVKVGKLKKTITVRVS